MRKEDIGLLTPGTRVLVGPKMLGMELYGWSDPKELEKYLGKEMTVDRVREADVEKTFYVDLVGTDTVPSFIIEEIECIIPDTELEESDMDLGSLIGF